MDAEYELGWHRDTICIDFLLLVFLIYEYLIVLFYPRNIFFGIFNHIVK